MELKTKVDAEQGRQDLTIHREFDLPVELLYKAYAEAEFLEQWMGTRVVLLENRNQGYYRFETTDPRGMVHVFQGCIHSVIPNEKIVRTFEMLNTPFEPQLEFIEFHKVDEERSRLQMHVIYRSAALRDQLLQMPFAQGINMAHNRLESYLSKHR